MDELATKDEYTRNGKGYKVLIAAMGLDIGGAETHILELCKILHKKGVDLYVVSNGGVYEKELVDAGVKHFQAPLHNKKPGSLLKSYSILKKIITENNIKLVHAHARIPAFISSLLKKKLGFHLVTTAHLNFSITLPYKILSNWGEAALAVSGDIRDYLVKNYHYPPERILLTINGVDTEKFSGQEDYSGIAREFGFDPGLDTRKIVYLSRMDTDRSYSAHILCRIAPEIAKAWPDTEMILVGGGNDFENVRKAALEANRRIGSEYIKLTGSRADTNKFMSAADIFVGVSRAALEAMSSSKPLILAGNQGYLGIFGPSSLEAGMATNFCCRGFEGVTEKNLKRDLEVMLSKTREELQAMGTYNRQVIEENYSVDKMGDDALALYRLARKPYKRYDVMISGYYGFHNHGDDALLKAITGDLRKIKPDIKIIALSQRPGETAAAYQVESVSRMNLPLIYKHLKNTNLLLFGGGSLVQDYTTRSLFYYLMLMRLAIRRGAKTMLYANGVGPLRRKSNRNRAAKTLKKLDLITLRDDDSLAALKELGISDTPVEVTADAVFSLPGATASQPPQGIQGKYFMVAMRSWKNLRGDFESTIAAAADSIGKSLGYTALFVPMQPQKDEEISRKIMSLMKSPAAYMGNDFSIDEILSVCAGAEFVLAMRLHTIIYAAISKTPVIGLVYDPKVEGVMKKLSQEYYMKVEDAVADTILAFACNIAGRREEIGRELEQRVVPLSQKAFENARYAYEMINRDLF